MSKRLVWNFEINSNKPLQLPDTHAIATDDMRWESRFFWPQDAIITLNGLDDSFLELSRYKIKHRPDSYYLLPDVNYNIKLRREQLLYKPLLKQSANAIAYGKKLKLEEQEANKRLHGSKALSAQQLMILIKQQGRKVQVEKEALIYEFATQPVTKMELARLTTANKTYYSVSIESRAESWVEMIATHLLGDAISSDYVTFLKTIA